MRLTAIAFSAFALSACVSSGVQVTEQQAAQFQKGVTTEADVRTKLGAPNSVARLSDGSSVLVYAHIEASPNAVDFVPIVGLFAGGAHGHSTAVSFTFGPDGKLSAYSSTATDTEVHSGVVN